MLLPPALNTELLLLWHSPLPMLRQRGTVLLLEGHHTVMLLPVLNAEVVWHNTAAIPEQRGACPIANHQSAVAIAQQPTAAATGQRTKPW